MFYRENVTYIGVGRMRERFISLRTAVIIPIVLIMMITLTIFVVFNKRDYEFLANEQGTRILTALYENTEQRLSKLLIEPQRANTYYEDYISRAKLYEFSDVEKIETYTLEFMSKIRKDLPQISVVSYGDEMGNYVGYRVNNDENYELMLKDNRTDLLLNIYGGTDLYSEVLGSFEGYDPRTRPWYKPVKEVQEIQWSEVYVNYDEKMELTISSLMPVFDDENTFKGVAELDVKLDMINDFLVDEKVKGNGVIYIVDENWNILANSLDQDFMKIIEGDPPAAVMLPAFESDNAMIRSSAEGFRNSEVKFGEITKLMIDDNRHFSMYSPLKNPVELNWKIVVVIPETDIMGAVQKRQNTTLSLVSLVMIFGMLLGMITLSRITRPILESSEAALRFSEGEWETRLKPGKLPLYETYELVDAFNNMSDKLKDSFDEIQINEEKYRSLVENVDDMIYSLSADGEFISMNQSFEHALGVEAGSLIGKNYLDIFTTDKNKEFWKNKFVEVLMKKEKIKFEFEYVTGTGARVVISVNMIPQLDSEGVVQTILGTNTDITELIKAEEEIKRLLEAEKKELEALVEQRTNELKVTMKELLDRERLASLGSLVAGIAHEINTPLGVAVTASSYMESVNASTFTKLREGSLSKQALVEYMGGIEESSEIINTNLYRASELIRSFKEISVNQSIETLTNFNIYDYIQDVKLALKHEYKNTEHRFYVICEETLEIKSYPGAISQILTNLIMNSLTHGFSDDVPGLITIRAHVTDESLILEYEDDGVGITKENLTRIFDPFFTTNRKKGGSGLGLNIVYNLVTGRLNGKIQCESVVNEGVKFSIKVPLNH